MKKMNNVLLLLTLSFAFTPLKAEKILVGDYPWKAYGKPELKIHDSGIEKVAYVSQLIIGSSDPDFEDEYATTSLENYGTEVIEKVLSYKKNGKALKVQSDIYVAGKLCQTRVSTLNFLGQEKVKNFCEFSMEEIKEEKEYTNEYGEKDIKKIHRFQYFLNI